MNIRSLDPVQEHPMNVGPSRDMHAITKKEARYREEPFQFDAQRLPVSVRRRTRPATVAHKHPALPTGRANILIRNSNISPVESGSGVAGGQWRVNALGAYDQSGALPGMGADEEAGAHPTDVRGWSTGAMIGVGLIIGLAGFLVTRGR